MSLPDPISEQLNRLLCAYAGTQVDIINREPIGEGWTAQVVPDPWPWVTRCTVEDDTGVLPRSVIVKVRRPEDHTRGEAGQFHNERAALQFLTSLDNAVAPRLLAADDGILVMEDLGTGPALDDLLTGNDASAAEDGLVTFARGLARMHATTAGYAAEYYRLRSSLGPVDPFFERISIGGTGIEHAWSRLQEIVADRPYLPTLSAAGSDVDELLRVLSEPGPYLAFSNGDTCPQNCRLSEGGLRFIDFEGACFRHALLDATALRFPFQACPCWSRLPEDASRRAEDAYRKESARSCPDVLDHASYMQGLAAGCAAWTLVRAMRLPKLENADAPHPMGFSRRGQLLDAIAVTVSCAQESGALQSLGSWLADLADALRGRWPHIAQAQAVYPAFR
jgi:hypothetical protein